jgi:hypothetical protein
LSTETPNVGNVGGGISRAIRRKNVISADLAERPTSANSHFSGFSRASRRQFGGNCAIIATNAATIALFAAFLTFETTSPPSNE